MLLEKAQLGSVSIASVRNSKRLEHARVGRLSTRGWPSFVEATRHWSAHTPVGSWLRSQAVLSRVDKV